MGDVALSEGFWTGRRVLVTGHTGFKGSWLCLWLQRLGAHVTGLSDAVPTRPAVFDAGRVAEGMVDERGDVVDGERVLAVVAEHRPQVVLHLAAQPIVKLGYADPVRTYAVNVMGTAHVLEAVRRVGGVRVVVAITTDKVYENREWAWGYRERERLGGQDPYASSKAAAELVAAAYRHSFFAPGGHATRVATARAGNVIGGGDWAADRLVPDLLRGALSGRPVPIRNPAAIRPWQHVLNPLAGYLVLAERLWEDPRHAHGWNLGPDSADDRSVGWVADHLAELWGEGLRWEQDAAEHPHEARHLRLDSSLARAELGWRPGWDLEQALASIVFFARAQEAGADLREAMLGQIEAFAHDAPRSRDPDVSFWLGGCPTRRSHSSCASRSS